MKPQSIISITFLFLIASLSIACQGDSGQLKNKTQSIETTSISETSSNTGNSETPSGVPPVSQLDILQDYDRELWSGPDTWTDEQWKWKKQLKWDRNCDYIGEVDTRDISDRLQLITVQCVPGVYQATYYIFVFDRITKKNRQLKFGLSQNTDSPKEVLGTIEYDEKKNQMSILTLSRGVGDCGTYRVFEYTGLNDLDKELFLQTEKRIRKCKDYGIDSVEELPKSIFDYRSWPLVK